MPHRHARISTSLPSPRAAAPAATSGLTIVELLVALAIAGLLAALAVPAFHDWLGAYELANHTRAPRRKPDASAHGSHPPRLIASISASRPIGSQCADQGSWEAGFVMYVDVNHDGRIDAGEPVLGIEGPAPPGITITANRPLDDYVSYTSVGHARMLNGALQMGTFTVCRQRAARACTWCSPTAAACARSERPSSVRDSTDRGLRAALSQARHRRASNARRLVAENANVIATGGFARKLRPYSGLRPFSQGAR